ncbi:hypothetical protein QR680_015275 [Steinernema hermaphroditum]|uniref:Chitin-binding type-2 domain-containing protein n=1 Tax=Steinernema hermaphroditum TaxID=289476 RepID=A0AA39LJY5_9BILA|nr:hypothetical protein QR680_015275 [Steinernema hermaphroditum]
MIRSIFLVLFIASSLLLLDGPLSAAPMNQLMSVACERNPSLEMCGGHAAVYRAKDAPEDEDTRSMRSFPKMSYDELQLDRYCARHQDHYWHYCVGSGTYEGPLRAKLLKFCPSFEKFCPEVAGKASQPSGSNFREAAVPLVIPPPLPSKRFGQTMTSPMAFDLPLPSSKDDDMQEPTAQGPQVLTPEIIRTCTADCTAPHCTTECKCANTHPTVHAMCNPPANSELATTCQHWYSKCPMFKPVQY